MADTIKTNLGPVTAYANAKAHGYTGTREEFGQLLANAGLNLKAAETAKADAEAAKQAAETAQQAAASSASSASTSASTATTQAAAAKSSADAAASSATAAKASEAAAEKSAQGAAASESAAKAAQTAAETAKANADTAASNAAANATAAANSAVDAKKTLESIPADYSTLSRKVDDNTSGISELKENLANSKKAIAELNDKKITKFYASNLGETTLNDSDNGKIADMMLYGKSEQFQGEIELEDGTTVTVPCPDYPQEIKSVVNPVVKVCGKNLWKYDSKHEGTGYINKLSDIFIEKGKTYTINVNESSRWLYQISPSKEDSDAYGNYYTMVSASATATFTSQIDGYLYLRVVDPSTKENIQVEVGEIATDFEPYTEQLITLPYTLNAIPVDSGGNVTIDGQQYIADYVDVERGKLVKMVDSSKLDNTQSIVDKTEWLLAEPQEVSLADEEVRTFKALATYYPATNISINSEQLDGYTVFNYPISMENGWNYVKQQIGDTRDFIYDMDLQSAEAYVNSEYAVALTELEV